MANEHDDSTGTGRTPRPADSIAGPVKAPRILESMTVKLGHAAGSTAMTRIEASSRSARPMNGNVRPEKFEPPPVQPMRMSG